MGFLTAILPSIAGNAPRNTSPFPWCAWCPRRSATPQSWGRTRAPAGLPAPMLGRLGFRRGTNCPFSSFLAPALCQQRRQEPRPSARPRLGLLERRSPVTET